MNRSIAVLTLALAGNAHAAGCKFERDIDTTLDLAGTDLLTVAAAAGDLEISGRPGIREARVRGRICVSEEPWLAEADVVTEGGPGASIRTVMPDVGSGWNLLGSRYAYIDLEIDVPDDLALQIRDSSGDLEVEGIGPVGIRDSSGDIELEDIGGSVELEDSSGDIEARRIAGDFTVISDSSGDIEGAYIEGSVQVENDSSGDISFKDVTGDYIVGRDSSGDILAKTVGGDFRVLRDGSGSIRAKDVSGVVETPEHH